MNLVLLHHFLEGEVAWRLQVAVLLFKRWIRFLAQEIVQLRKLNTQNHRATHSMLYNKIRLAFKMLILTEVQYLHSECINCDDLDVQELWSNIINLSDFVKIQLIGGISVFAMYSAFLFAWDSYSIIYKGKNSTPECVGWNGAVLTSTCKHLVHRRCFLLKYCIVYFIVEVLAAFFLQFSSCCFTVN